MSRTVGALLQARWLFALGGGMGGACRMGSRQHGAARLRRLRRLMLLVPLVSASCADLARNDQGNLQPQTVRGPCQVKKFFILSQTAVRTDMTVGNVGQACRFTIFNPDLQVVLNAALVTGQPSHGRATAELITLGRQAAVSYVPQPGYAGPDQFSITLEPNDFAVIVAVTVQPSPPAP